MKFLSQQVLEVFAFKVKAQSDAPLHTGYNVLQVNMREVPALILNSESEMLNIFDLFTLSLRKPSFFLFFFRS